MSNYEGKLEKLIQKCYDDIAAYVKTYFTSVEQGNGMVDVVIYEKKLPELRAVTHLNPGDDTLITVYIDTIRYMDFGSSGSIYLRGQFVNIPIEELTNNDVCCLADYVNSL